MNTVICELDQQGLEQLLFEGEPVDFLFKEQNIKVKVVNMDHQGDEDEV